MAEPQEKRSDNTNSGNDTKQNNSQKDTNQQNASSSTGSSSTAEAINKVESALGVESGTTKDIYNQAKETASQALGTVSEKATTQIDEKKVNLARGLSSVADSIRQMGDNLRTEEELPVAGLTAKYGESLANQVEQISDYLEQKDLREVLRDVESFARRNPAVFLGGAFALGLLAARFLKSSSENTGSSRGRRSLNTTNLKGRSEFRSDGVHLPDNVEVSTESSTVNEPFRFDTSDTSGTGRSGGNIGNTGSSSSSPSSSTPGSTTSSNS